MSYLFIIPLYIPQDKMKCARRNLEVALLKYYWSKLTLSRLKLTPQAAQVKLIK